MNKKPVLFFTTADDNNLPYAKMLEASFKHFHPDIPFHIVQGEELQAYLKDDPAFFYRQKPILGEKYLKEYELVVGIDADSIVTGDLSYLWKRTDYDVACVLNYSVQDIQNYGVVQGWGILPPEYVNCGLVSMRSEKFVHEWLVWCYSPQFERCQYREQDGLNIKVYHGNWNVCVLDYGDNVANVHAFWGLAGKDFWSRAVIKDDKIIIPKDENEPRISKFDTELKVLHFAGGQGATKMNYKTRFQEPVIERLDYLVSPVKKVAKPSKVG